MLSGTRAEVYAILMHFTPIPTQKSQLMLADTICFVVPLTFLVARRWPAADDVLSTVNMAFCRQLRELRRNPSQHPFRLPQMNTT